MEAILDFSVPLNIPLLEQVVHVFYTGKGAEQRQAQQTLTTFQEHPESWQRVPAILEQASHSQTKYVALQILEKLINTKWKILPAEQRSGIRNFIVGIIISISSDENVLRQEKSYINKLNLTLVQILKQEWPHNWPTFISEIVSSSKSNLSLCENNMVILKLMSEEIFDYSSDQMTTAKAKALKQQMCQEFSEVFALCHEVLQKSTKASLVKATLDTLLRFLAWIPVGYIFETDIIDILVSRYLEPNEFRNITLKCLSEMASLKLSQEYDSRFVILFSMVMTRINTILPPNTDIANVYKDSPDSDQELILNLALFLTNFLSQHLTLIENDEGRDVLLNAHLYLIKISQVDEKEIFKICLEYWLKLVNGLYEEMQKMPTEFSGYRGGFSGLGINSNGNKKPLRKDMYTEILSNLRLVMIENMVKPEEVLITENEEGEIVRVFMKEEIDNIVLYKSMKEALVYLTHLDVVDTEHIMTEKLAKQIDGSEWSWSNLNKLCWAIGSISRTMTEESEKRFLVNVIKDLLGLTEMKRGKDNKAVVASNIMYIVGQYPRFLKAHWKFLKTVVNKLFEFMHEYHEGVQDMACDTFIKIANRCRKQFVYLQNGESEPFVDEILRNMESITADLSSPQVNVFFEAVGTMISAQANIPVQERLLTQLMQMPNAVWDNVMTQAKNNVDVFSNPDNIKLLGNVLKTNVAACSSIGTFFLPQLGHIYQDMLSLYKAVSGIISETTASQGLIATKTPKIRGLRTVKKEILKLVETYINKALHADLEQINNTIIPPLLEAVLGDYNQNIPAARDAEVLNVMATIVSRLGNLLSNQVPDILAAVFECTLDMINKDFSEYPEHRVEFFKLIQKINIHCFSALLKLEQRQFKLLVDSVLWAVKHTTRDISDMGLSICMQLVKNVAEQNDANIASAFYSQYFLPILQDLFYILTDSEHKGGFKNQVNLLSHMFFLVESGTIQAPIFDPATVDDTTMTNQRYLKENTIAMLGNAFPNVTTAQSTAFVNGLFEYNQDMNKFRILVRDFLISLREFGVDNADLYQDEREEAQLEQERSKAMIPGMVKPSDMVQEDEEL